jgi:uncharacterized membrane protein
LQEPFKGRKVGNPPNLPIADDDISLTVDHWGHQVGYVTGLILVITVCIDDDVGSQIETRLDTGSEGTGQTEIAFMTNNMVYADSAGYSNRFIAAAMQLIFGISSGKPSNTKGSVSASLRQGIWMINFTFSILGLASIGCK